MSLVPRFRSVALLAAVTAAVALVASPASAGGRPFTTTLTGAAEVPGPGDPDGSGTAELTVNAGTAEVCWTITVANVDPITAAHIHVAPAGVAGPVVVPLSPDSGCRTVDRDLALAILLDPSQYYVNAHNAAYPAGAVRGQLSR